MATDVLSLLSLPAVPVSEQLAAAKPNWQELVIQSNLEYLFSCCAIPVGEESVCVLTDHQLLPLSWNRDYYYQLELARASYNDGDDAWKQRIQPLIKGHLLWMYEDAQRPEEYWGRAYLVNGACKDQVFQLDQQCYPLLELCEYYEHLPTVYAPLWGFCEKNAPIGWAPWNLPLPLPTRAAITQGATKVWGPCIPPISCRLETGRNCCMPG